jgi:molybdate transport system regulatory protein
LLTDHGRKTVALYRALEAEYQAALDRLAESMNDGLAGDFQQFRQLLRRMSMKTSARNQFAGTVSAIDIGPVSAEVIIALKSGDSITATLTSTAARRLKLKKGKEALALIKASAVVLVSDFAGWQLSARNQLTGTVSRIERGAVSSLVVLTLPGGAALTATLTNQGLEALGLKVGAPATAVFKAYAVMVATQA